MPRPVPLATALLAAAIFAGGEALASDAGIGREIAQRWCAGCHAVEGRGADLAPPLASIANKPEFVEGYYWTWLSDPHPPMPNLYLSRQEIADIIAYLRTLRDE
jgi:mono/diheme cytochrome c family protein